MRPEQKLVLAVCRAAFAGSPLDLDATATNLPDVVCLADELGVLGLVSSHLRGLPSADPLWNEVYRTNAARNVMLVAELRRWHDGLCAAGIEPILLKGPALAKSAFGSLARRDSCDLDLVVPFEQFRQAVNVCRALGGVPLATEVIPANDEAVGAMTFSVPSRPYSIDLHAGWLPPWGHLDGRHIPDEDLAEIQLGVTCRTLGPELSLLHASAHFWQHFFSLKSLVDLTATLARVRKLGLEHGCLVRAERMRVLEKLCYSIRAADGFLASGEIPPPPGFGSKAVKLMIPPRRRWDLWVWDAWPANKGGTAFPVNLFRRFFPQREILRHTPEWIAPEHLLLRRALRPVRLSTRLLSAIVSSTRSSWRRRPL